jgi:dihydroflavonol-4-reductase
MRALVTGATGYIGVPLVRELLGRGWEVRALVRQPDRARATLGGATLVSADLFDVSQLTATMRGCDAVFHLAGMVSFRGRDVRAVHRTNREGTRAVAAATLAAGVPRLVHVSSIVAVGVSWDASQMLDETATYNAGPLSLAYFDSKHDAEREVREAVDRGLDAVMLNPAGVVSQSGAVGGDGRLSGLIRALARMPLLLPGGNNWVDMGDVIDALLVGLERGRRGERYILGAENVSFVELQTRLATVIGRRPARFRAWPRLLRAAGRYVQTAARLSGFYLYADSSKARKELGWQPRSPWPAIEAMARSS